MGTIPKIADVFYPESDGKPMADNTLQFEWITKIQGAIDYIFLDREDVFVAGDLLWYPVEGNSRISAAPDTMVVFGRPKGHRRSYLQWEEGGIAPQVVFEVLSNSNTTGEMLQKQLFYEKYGVEEYCLLDPNEAELYVWKRENGKLVMDANVGNQWKSELLNLLFMVENNELTAFYPNGEEVKNLSDTKAEAAAQKQIAEEQAQIAAAQKKIAENERLAKEKALCEIERLKAELKKQKGE